MGAVAGGAMGGTGEGAPFTLAGGVGIGDASLGACFGTDALGEGSFVTSRTGCRGGTVADGGATAAAGGGAAFALPGGVVIGGVIVAACFGTDSLGKGCLPASRTGFLGGMMVASGKGV